VVAGGVADPGSGSVGFLTALTSSGARAVGFGAQGTVVYGPQRSDFTRPGEMGRFLVRARGGSLFVAGLPTADHRSAVWKRRSSGVRALGFGASGVLRLPNGRRPIALGAGCNDGPVVVNERQVLQFTARGARDARFGVAGVVAIGGGRLRQVDSAAFDQGACRVLAVAAGRVGRRGAIIARSIAVPGRPTPA